MAAGAAQDAQDAPARIERVEAASRELVGALGELVHDLTRSASAPTTDEVEALVRSDATTLLIARDNDDGGIIGSLTLVILHLPTGIRTWIEDATVLPGWRGQGIGAALTDAGLRLAEEAGARSVELVLHPSQMDAREVFKRAGFHPYQTELFRLRLAAHD